jgi:hypothetical protein
MRKWMVLGILVAMTGCDSGLVTGYQPRRLGASPAQRRAYYAGKYTPESHAAQQENVEEIRGRRPGASPGGPSPY